MLQETNTNTTVETTSDAYLSIQLQTIRGTLSTVFGKFFDTEGDGWK